VNTFADTILRWYALYGRDLPWRRTRDPYAVWLSEIILQQTRIAQGTAYWERFMQRFPTVQSLADASEDEVLRLWEGLGYYSRARNLHAAARQIVALGSFPDTLEGIRSLKGVGDYTAAAIGSICFGLPAAVLDGNVYRVLARHFGIGTPVGTPAAKKEFTALAQKLLPVSSAAASSGSLPRCSGPVSPEEPLPAQNDVAAYNQGLMDFGALQCTPQNPDCLTCPLQASCNAFRTGRVALLPVKKAPAAVSERHFSYIYVRCDGFTAIRRRGPGDIWQGLYEPLLIELLTHRGTNPPEPLRRSAPKEPQTSFPSGIGHLTPLRQAVRHQLTHRLLIADFYLWEPSARPELPEGYIWIPEEALDTYAKPRLFELLLSAVASGK